MSESRSERRERRRWERSMQRQLAELDRVARSTPLSRSGRSTRRRRPISPVWPGLLISAVLAGAVMLSDPGITGYRLHQFLDQLVHRHHAPYTFILTAPGGEPVGWDHCRPIDYVVNPQGAPDDWQQTVRDAVDQVRGISGFTFHYDGTTHDRTFQHRLSAGSLSDPPPVIIAWATPAEVPELAGKTAGIGGSTPVSTGGRVQFATGIVVLDRDAFAEMQLGGSERTEELILEHELGHVLGLGHVKDTRELMNAEYVGQSGFGPGDREGLAKLRDLPCS